MKTFRLCSTILGILAAICAAVSIIFAVSSVSQGPKLLKAPDSAQERTQALMELVCSGAFDDASLLLSGTPDLGLETPAAGTPEALIWDAWLDSLRYEFSGDCYVTSDGIARDVTVWGLDIPLTTQAISAEAQLLLEERLANSADGSGIYDADGNLSKTFADQILYDATVKGLSAPPQEVSRQMTLTLKYEHNQWMIVPDTQLQTFLSGQLR